MRQIQSSCHIVTVVFFLALAAGRPALSQESYPIRPIRVVSTTPAGAIGDVVLRAIAEKASVSLGQPIIIETQSAATGQVATQAVVRADPDGYFLLWGNSNLVNTQVTKKDLPFDILRDLAPISLTVSSPVIIAINAELPIHSAAEFVQYVKAHPNELAFGSPGRGSGLYLTGEMLAKAIGTKFVHIPYANTGASAFITDLMQNRIQLLFTTLPTIQPVLTTGRIRLIAVLAKDRYGPFPELPSIFDTVPNYQEVPVWFGMLGPRNTPDAIRDVVSEHLRKAANAPEVKEKLEKLGLVIEASTPSEMGAIMEKGLKDMSALVKEIKLDTP